jgi:hypothetical protein
VTDAARLSAYERRFRRAGLPLLIEDYSASTNVFNRAVPLLVLVFFGEMLGATSLDWSFAANVGAALGGLAILLCAGAIVNRVRGGAHSPCPMTSAASSSSPSCSCRPSSRWRSAASGEVRS